MNDNITLLYEKFNKIKKLGWVRSERGGSGGIGYTFEKLIGKKEDTFFLPDFNGIEIKTKHHFSKGNITLFSLTPDGEYLYPIEYLRTNYGYPDSIVPSQNRFNHSVGNAKKEVFKNCEFRLNVDRDKEKIILEIKNLKTKKIDSNVSWSFQSVKDRLYIKLSYLALVKAISKYKEDVEYFHYYDIKFYKLKDFDTFLKLIEDGTIYITFKVGIFHSGDKLGKVNDHGTGFEIHINDVPALFNQIEFQGGRS